MKIIDLLTGEPYALTEQDRISCALGNFDGVHLGHQALLAAACRKGDCTKSAVWTFSEPSSRLMGGISLLTEPGERLELFRKAGVDLVFLTDFETVRGLDRDAFVKDVLYDACHVRRAVCGFNFRYGARAAGNAETLCASLRALGGETVVIPPFQLAGRTVSSSEIRRSLADGDTEEVTAMLGRPYTVTSPVLHGKKLGRTLGFPTVNQRFPALRALPRFGVYAVRVAVDGKIYGGVTNVGCRPTVEDGNAVNAETFLLDFEGDLYGKTLTTEFLHFLRPERRFPDLAALKAAVELNILEARAYFEAQRNGT